MKLRYFIPAVLSTLFILAIQLVLPFAYDWYMTKLGWENTPFGAIMLLCLASIGAIAFNIYLYILSFSDD